MKTPPLISPIVASGCGWQYSYQNNRANSADIAKVAIYCIALGYIGAAINGDNTAMTELNSVAVFVKLHGAVLNLCDFTTGANIHQRASIDVTHNNAIFK